jgi:hypothetical protein
VGAGRIVLIGGEAGSGRTALVREFEARIAGSLSVSWADVGPGSEDSATGELDRLIETFAGGTAEGPRPAPRGPGLDSALAALAGGPPRVVVLDDVHRAGPDVLDLLMFLARRLHRLRVLMLVTYRDDEAPERLRPVIADLARQAGVLRVAVLPLSDAGVASMVGDREMDVGEVARLTGGNPSLVSQLLAHQGPGVPFSVRRIVLSRAASLTAGARRTLAAASVLGPSFEYTLLERAIGPAASDVEACIASGLLVGDGTRVAFRHDLDRRVIVGALTLGVDE